MEDQTPVRAAGSFPEVVLFLAVILGVAAIVTTLATVTAPDAVKFLYVAILAILTAICIALFALLRR